MGGDVYFCEKGMFLDENSRWQVMPHGISGVVDGIDLFPMPTSKLHVDLWIPMLN